MTKKLLPLLIVIAAIASLVFFPAIKSATKGNKTMTETATENVSVMLETSMGNITIEIDMENAPNTGKNFLAYADDGYFAETIFHRIIPNFMIQGGGMTADMSDKPSKHAAIKNEANNGLKNDRGTLAMARTGDPHSATSQFFINHANNGFLNHTSETAQGWGYAVFGKVTDGMHIADAMAVAATGNNGGHGDVPLETNTIIGASRP